VNGGQRAESKEKDFEASLFLQFYQWVFLGGLVHKQTTIKEIL